MSNATFDTLEQTLTLADAACDASECHGTLCGVLCTGAGLDDAWMEHILGESRANPRARDECQRILAGLRDDTHAALKAGAMEFTPFLPSDEVSLATRTAALGEWCQGFLFGIGLGGAERLEALTAEAGEVLKDMTEIAQAGFEGEAGSEEDENAYAEIVEYLRVGVQLLYEELQAMPGSVPSPSSTLH